MRNSEIAQIFEEIAIYLSMEEESFRSRAYREASDSIAGLGEDLSDIYRRSGIEGLKNVPGVGVSIAEKIEELLKTEKLEYYDELKKKTPVELKELLRVEGLGPKNIKRLYIDLKIKNLKDLERAVKLHKIRELEGFGEKSEENILKGIEFLIKAGDRIPLGIALPIAERIKNTLKNLGGVEMIDVAGSIRRRKETIGDVDILIVSNKPAPIMDCFVNLPDVARIYGKGATKSSVRLKDGIDADLRIVRRESYGAALCYFTGSKEHNVSLRSIAIKKGLKLNEYGLYSGNKMVAGKTEEEIYKKLGLKYISPEMRENLGEINLAKEKKLPKLINYGEIVGDLQVQTTWTDGENSIEECVAAAKKFGLKYIVITDHTKNLAMTHGLDEKRIVEQMKEIDKLNKKLKSKGDKFTVLKGTECDILKDGRLDLPDNILSKLDVVGVSVHSYFNLPKKIQTERVKKAMANKNADILFHPTGRLIMKREAIDIDIEEIIEHAQKTKTVLEINGAPERLDFKDEYIRKCIASGVKMAINSDAHSIYQFGNIEYGVSQARRGWATKEDIINAWPLTKMIKMLK